MSGEGKIGAMEFDLLRSLEMRATLPVFSSAASRNESELSLEISLGPGSGGESCRKRSRENDGTVQGKKSKMMEASFEFFIKPAILQAPVEPGGIPRSGPLPGAEEGLVTSTPPPAVADPASSSESGASGISDPFQISPATGKKSCSDESNPVPKHSPLHAAGGEKLAGRAPLAGAQLPAVSTKSITGKKTKGYLHRSSTNEVRIICDCHGRIFSPKHFVRHAGGLETPHPLRQIIMD